MTRAANEQSMRAHNDWMRKTLATTGAKSAHRLTTSAEKAREKAAERKAEENARHKAWLKRQNDEHKERLAATDDRFHGYRSDTGLSPEVEAARELAARRKSEETSRRKTQLRAANARHETNLAKTADRRHGYRSDTALTPEIEEARKLAEEKRKIEARKRRATLAKENTYHGNRLAATEDRFHGYRSETGLSTGRAGTETGVAATPWMGSWGQGGSRRRRG